MKRFPIGFAIGGLLSLIFVGGFVSGALVQRTTQSSALESSDPNLREFLYAYHLVTQRSYYRPFNAHHLVYAAIDGMLSATGDPHTLFLSPPQNGAANQQLNGQQFGGIGAIVVPARGNLQVIAPIPNAPAARAGIIAGDIVIAINGTPISRIRGTGPVAHIHGKAGTVVRLTIVHGHDRARIVSVKREKIPPITAYGRLLPESLGYIQIMSFGEDTSHEVAQSLVFMKAHHVRGIVLDLRGNPGGYVDTAQQIVSQFMPRGVVAYERTENAKLEPLNVLPDRQTTTVPLAVLVDESTASAAEITAAALRDNGRATIIGSRTYGKGSMQSVYSLSDGSSIRITDRLWLTPRRVSIQKVGIQPDIVLRHSASGLDSGLQRALRYFRTLHRAK